MIDSRDFQVAESVRSGHSHVPSQPVSFPLDPVPAGMLNRSTGMPSRKDGPPSIWDTHGISGNVFCQSCFVLFSTLFRRKWIHGVPEQKSQLHSSTVEKIERRIQDQDQRCQSGPSAKNSVTLQWWRLSKELWGRPTATADFRSSYWQIPYTRNICLLEDQIQDWGMYLFTISLRKLCNGSKKWRWLIQWMNWRSSSSIRGIQMPNFEVLDARIASALNKIIHNSHKKIQSGGTKGPEAGPVPSVEDRLLTWSTNTSGSLGANDSVENYTDLFTVGLRNDNVQEFDSKWDGILLSLAKIPPDDILEGLLKFRITRVWETYQDRIWIVWLGDSSEKVRTWLTQIENDDEKKYRARYSEIRILGAKNGNFEKNAVVKNQGTKQRVQRILGDCWQWETNGQCVKGDNCSFRHDINKRGKSSPVAYVSEFFHVAEWAKSIENPKSQRKKSQW